MKFVEITIVVLCITLALSVVTTTGLIPDSYAVKSYNYGGKINTHNNTYEVVNGSVVCSEAAKTQDMVCQIRYLKDNSVYKNLQSVDSASLFGFSDIVRGASLLSDIVYKTTVGLGDLFDYFVKPCIEYDYATLTCTTRNNMYSVKYFFIVPIYLIYLLAFLELITGRNITGDK